MFFITYMKGPKPYHSESELFSTFYSRPKTATYANWTSTSTRSVATTRMTTTLTSRTTATSILLTHAQIRQVIGNPHHPCQEISYHTSYLLTFRVDSNKKKHVQMLRSHSIKKENYVFTNTNLCFWFVYSFNCNF